MPYEDGKAFIEHLDMPETSAIVLFEAMEKDQSQVKVPIKNNRWFRQTVLGYSWSDQAERHNQASLNHPGRYRLYCKMYCVAINDNAIVNE